VTLETCRETMSRKCNRGSKDILVEIIEDVEDMECTDEFESGVNQNTKLLMENSILLETRARKIFMIHISVHFLDKNFFVRSRDMLQRCEHTKFEQNRTENELCRSNDSTVHTRIH
jgi:hypothetical protein